MIDSSTWSSVIEKYGVVHSANGHLQSDPFAMLASDASMYKAQGYEPARLNVSTHNGIDYGQVKVVISLNIVCPQTEKHIQVAAEAGFLKALELVNEASASLGIPELPKVY